MVVVCSLLFVVCYCKVFDVDGGLTFVVCVFVDCCLLFVGCSLVSTNALFVALGVIGCWLLVVVVR